MAGQLDAYHKKRDFTTTGEPRGRVARTKGRAFVVQKHAARRLHYDFRLELNGVLKSWAVARGPSLSPHEKRLAVHVEDHPLDYGAFEGRIPDGQYGAGSVLLWDKGVWTPEGDPHAGYEKGHLAFSLDGEKLKGRWNLVRMRGKKEERHENWLLIKVDDDAARADDEPDILEEQARSVASGRSIEQIGSDKKSKEWRSRGHAGAAGAKVPTIAGERSPRRRAAEALRQVGQNKVQQDKSQKASAGARRTAIQPKASRKTTSSKRAAAIEPPKGACKERWPGFVRPALATLVTSPPTGDWLHEIKFDGYRLQAARHDGKTQLLTRNGLDWTTHFAPLAEAIDALPAATFILDGEVVVENSDGVSDFSQLQAALKDQAGHALRYYIFDLLYLNGFSLLSVPLEARKTALAELLGDAGEGPLRYSEHFKENGEAMLRHVCALSGEGIVSKASASLYRSRRTNDWLKIKCANRQEFIIVGFVPSTRSSKAIGSLVLAVREGDALVAVGRAGTGYTADTASELYDLLHREGVDRPPVAGPLPAQARRNVRWVEPRRVAEVEFRGWTADDQLRQAAYKGLREDKKPDEIVREKAAPVRAALKREPPSKAQAASRASPKAGPAPIAAPSSKARPAPEALSGVKLTHPDRVLWPKERITKQDLAEHYARVWPLMAPFIQSRPITLVRCPGGVAQSCFFQKHPWDGMNEHAQGLQDAQSDHPLLMIKDGAGLLAFVQAAALEIHIWGAGARDLDRPDMLVFDLDPGEGIAWADLVRAARETRERLAAQKLTSFVKTSGGKGLHVSVPLAPRADWTQAKAFCKQVAEAMAKDSPTRYLAKMTKSERRGRIFIDYLRNGRGATSIAPYSTRARPECGVSMPIAWEELDELDSGAHFTLNTTAARLAETPDDPWANFFKTKQTLRGGAK